MLPWQLDGGFHIVSYDDRLWRPVAIMAAKCDNVCLRHSGRENSEKNGGKEGTGFTLGIREGFVLD